MTDYRDELEIDLKDLFFSIIKRWKLLIVFMLIGGILGGIGGYIKAKDEVLTAIEKSTSESADKSLEGKFTAKELYEVNTTLATYKDFSKRYNELLEYKNNAPIMEIDGYNCPTSTCVYVISDFENEDDLNVYDGKTMADNIINLYAAEISKPEVRNAIKSTMGTDIDVKYISEMYSVSKSGYSLMYVLAYGRDTEESQKNLQLLENVIDEHYETIKAQIDHNLVKATTSTNNQKVDSVIAIQENVTNRLRDLNNAMITVANNLSADQKTYFNNQLNESNLEEGTTESLTEDNEVSTVEPELSMKTIVKFLAIGLIGGLFCIVFLLAVLYIMRPTVKTEDDIKKALKLPIIGRIPANKPELVELAGSGIRATAKANSAKKICLISTYTDSKVEEFRNKIAENVRAKDIDIVECGNVFTDPESLNTVISSDAVVLFETIKKSRYEDIANVQELCRNYKLNVLGTVILNLE